MRHILVAAALAATFGPAAIGAQASAGLKWGPAPDVFPKGATMAVVSGDPGQAAAFTIQLSMPDGYQIKPHMHPTAENVVVKKGTFLVGMGDTWDLSKANPMAVGAKGAVPAHTAHFAQAKGPTIVEVSAMGPFAMTYVHPADDPRKATTQ